MASTVSKAEKLAIAGYAAPRLRGARARRVKVTNAAGEVIREITSTELAVKILARAEIEFDAEPGSVVDGPAPQQIAIAQTAATKRQRNGAGNYSDDETIAKIVALREAGHSLREIAEELGIHRETVSKYAPRVSRPEALRRKHRQWKSNGRPVIPPRRKRKKP